ncbi:MAG: hypothetical protein GY715_22055 [Planctomycetes bacterium]|nr:hypothetical protein [Planctomycetota bacterium]
MKRYMIERLLGGAILVTAVAAYPATALAGKPGSPKNQDPVKHTNQDRIPPFPPTAPPPPPPGGLFHDPGSNPIWIDILFVRTINPFGDQIRIVKYAPPAPALPPDLPLDDLIGDPMQRLDTLPDGLIPLPLAPEHTPRPPATKVIALLDPGLIDAPSRTVGLGDAPFDQPLPAPGALSLITLGALTMLGRRRRRTATA